MHRTLKAKYLERSFQIFLLAEDKPLSLIWMFASHSKSLFIIVIVE